MNASSSQLSVDAQLFSKRSLYTTILFGLVGLLFIYLTLAVDSPTTLILTPVLVLLPLSLWRAMKQYSAAEYPPRALLPELQAMVGRPALIST